eukprot:12929640-Alexandrium_andersonii.AAC.1
MGGMGRFPKTAAFIPSRRTCPMRIRANVDVGPTDAPNPMPSDLDAPSTHRPRSDFSIWAHRCREHVSASIAGRSDPTKDPTQGLSPNHRLPQPADPERPAPQVRRHKCKRASSRWKSLPAVSCSFL